MTRYCLSTHKRAITVTVDEQNIVRGVTYLAYRPLENLCIGDDLDNLLESLREEGQVEMMEI